MVISSGDLIRTSMVRHGKIVMLMFAMVFGTMDSMGMLLLCFIPTLLGAMDQAIILRQLFLVQLIQEFVKTEFDQRSLTLKVILKIGQPI